MKNLFLISSFILISAVSFSQTKSSTVVRESSEAKATTISSPDKIDAIITAPATPAHKKSSGNYEKVTIQPKKSTLPTFTPTKSKEPTFTPAKRTYPTLQIMKKPTSTKNK